MISSELMNLVEKALMLTGQTRYSVSDIDFDECELDGSPVSYFNWYRFCYYLLSPEFIEKYKKPFYDFDQTRMALERVSFVIYEYQSGNEQPLIDLLSNIK